MSLTGRTVLVTGASGGIGREVVRQARHAGADVIASGRTGESLEDLVAETGASALLFDVSDESAVAAAVGPLQLWGVVNCAGFGGEIAAPVDADLAVFDQAIKVNTRGPLVVIKYAARSMIASKRGGSIVNVSSQAALAALPGHISYAASKATVSPGLRLWSSAVSGSASTASTRPW